MKRTFPTCLAVLTVLLGCTFTAAAAASTPRASGGGTAEQAFQIDMATNRALLHVSGAAVSQSAKRAQRLMTPCITRDFVQVTQAEASNSNASKALTSLSEEAGVEYEMAAVQPVMRPLLRGVQRLLSLKLSAKLRADVKSYLAAIAKVQSLNACSDAQAWLTAGLTQAQEPQGTAEIAVALADFRKVTSSKPQVNLGDLPPAQAHALKLEKTRAGKHANLLILRSVLSLEGWFRQLMLNVEKLAAASTTTSTTTTPTTTTPTTTGAGTTTT